MKPQHSKTTNVRTTTSNEDRYLSQFTKEPVSQVNVDRLYGRYHRELHGHRQIDRRIEYYIDNTNVVLPHQWHRLLDPNEIVLVDVVTVFDKLNVSKTYILSMEKRQSNNQGARLSIDKEVSLGSLNIESDVITPFFIWLWLVRLISLVSVVFLISIEEKIVPLTLLVISVLIGIYLRKRSCNPEIKNRNREIELRLNEYYWSLDSFLNQPTEKEIYHDKEL